MLLKPKYGRFRNDSVTSSDDLMQSLAMSGKVVATPVASLSTQGLELPPLETAALPPPSAQVLADSPGLDGEQDGTTTFCMLIPKMPHWKFSNSLLSRSPSNSSSSSGSSKDSGRAHTTDTSAPASGGATAASGPVASLAAVFNSCDPVCVGPCSLQAIRRHRVSGNSASLRDSSAGASEGSPGGSGSSRTGMNRRTRVEGIWLGDNFTQKGSFMNKPSQGWLHPDKKISSIGASYIVRVTNKTLQSIMGKSNLRFAGMSIGVNISIEGLSLLVPTTRQVIAHHPMQSISFASGGDSDTPDYVAYVAKDPVNQRACHIMECSDGLAQNVISTIGQAFELQFKLYLHSPPKAIPTMDRNIRTEESAWGDDEESSEHDYYNSIPGKEPPVGGVVDSRLRHPVGLLGLSSDGYLRADGHPPGSRDYEEHLYVNTQNLDNMETSRGHKQESPKKDIFDMRPFEDALRLHEAGGVCILEDKWPSPPHRRAPIAPTEDQLRREVWYHGRMSRRDAENLLGRDGDFLVRDSATNPGQYVLTGMQCGLPKHLLLVDPEGVVGGAP
ncbi:SHC-transforming protein 2 [Triplophysa tibetana]|uniref:SHC-transforming protein 2 n=1 Tax=Triplophysa tibetana TaxID=1572043 RepID=A0A5A9NS40_9TELE|nr:SHC-transforming protein 2 [Triplophysa tibetana]